MFLIKRIDMEEMLVIFSFVIPFKNKQNYCKKSKKKKSRDKQ
jgi:hypothetical protein